MPGLTLLPPSRAAMRASARSRPRPYPALASVVCVLMLPCVCPFLVRLSLLASLVCLSFFSSGTGDMLSCRVQRHRLAVPAPAQPARPRYVWCAICYSRAGRGVVSGTIGAEVGCRSVVLLSVAVALSTTHPITPHHILHTAHTSRKPHTPPAPPRHSHLTRRAPHTHCIYHTLTKPDITPPTPRTSHTHHIHTTPHPFITRHIKGVAW